MGLKRIFWGGIQLWVMFTALCGLLYIPVAEPVFAGALLLVSMVLSWGLYQSESL